MNPHIETARRAMQAYGQEVHRKRIHEKLSTRQLGELIGLRHDQIVRVESGMLVPSDEVEAALSGWLTSRRHQPSS